VQKIEHFSFRPIPEKEQTDLISVIVAVYNIEAYLEKCVRSIREQTYRNLQIILVDDGSTDGCPGLCDRLAGEDDRIQVIHKENGGLSDARNAGTGQALGSYIAFVDGDDWIEKDMYEGLLSAARQFDAPLAVCRYRKIYRDRAVDEATGAAVYMEGLEALDCFLREEDDICIQNAAWNKLYRRELMGELRFPKGKYYEDIVYTTKLLARASGTIYMDFSFYNYVLEREGSIMGEGLGERIFTDQLPAYEEKEAFLRSIDRMDLADIHRYFFYKRLLLYYISLGKAEKDFRRKYRKEIRERLRADSAEMDRVYQNPAANPNEKKKMMIFLKSPAVYLCVIWLNDRFIIPLKQRVRGR